MSEIKGMQYLKNKLELKRQRVLDRYSYYEMKNVVELANKEHIKAKIIIGGAVVTEDYAFEIGADGYSSDAADAVRLVKTILSIT